MSFSAVGNVFDLPGFRQHLRCVDLSWARGVCLHHTAIPDLAMRPKGWTVQHMRNLIHYYGTQLGWSAGPHLFTDEDEIFGLSPLSARGVHAVSFNATHIGIEALGNYDTEDPRTGRGKEVWDTTIAATAEIFVAAGWEVTDQTLRFHRQDPKARKTCPGRRVDFADVFEAVAGLVEAAKDHDHDDQQDPAPDRHNLLARLDAIEWQTARIRAELSPKP
jgi:hypothetical protein